MRRRRGNVVSVVSIYDEVGPRLWFDPCQHEPREDLFGLSPAQARVLVSRNWGEGGPVRIETTLPLHAFHGSGAFDVLRRFILRVEESGRFPLSWVDVAGVPDVRATTGMGAREPDSSARAAGSFTDHWSELNRAFLQAGALGLVEPVDRVARITELGSDLARAERAGELYARLFRLVAGERSWMTQQMSLVGDDYRYSTIAPFALWALGQVADAWFVPMDLALALLPPWVVARCEDDGEVEWAAEMTTFLNTLPVFHGLGLTVERTLPDDDARGHEFEIRRAPLYGRVVGFEFGSGG